MASRSYFSSAKRFLMLFEVVCNSVSEETPSWDAITIGLLNHNCHGNRMCRSIYHNFDGMTLQQSRGVSYHICEQENPNAVSNSLSSPALMYPRCWAGFACRARVQFWRILIEFGVFIQPGDGLLNWSNTTDVNEKMPDADAYTYTEDRARAPHTVSIRKYDTR